MNTLFVSFDALIHCVVPVDLSFERPPGDRQASCTGLDRRGHVQRSNESNESGDSPRSDFGEGSVPNGRCEWGEEIWVWVNTY